jgi:SAM-dependent methyltransferase
MSPLPPAANRPPVLANERFQAHAANLIGHDTEAIFTYIYRTQLWSDDGSPSGVGAELESTAVLRRELPRLLRRYGVRSLLDLPCGDFGWLSHADLSGIDYTGADIVPDLVERNAERYAGPGRRFLRLNLAADPLPRTDVVLCRDCLVHLRYEQIFRAFANLRRSGSTYLLATTFLELDANAEIDTGDWRPLNLVLPPFALPDPLAVIIEDCTEIDGAYADKALGLWRVADLPERPRAARR